MFKNKQLHFKKGRLWGHASNLRINYFNKGVFALKSLENGYLTANQLEASRKLLKRFVGKRTKKNFPLFFKVVPLIAQSKKKKGMRMGGSKGGFYRFVYRARMGTVFFEVHGLQNYQILQKLKRAVSRFPVKSALLIKND